MTAKEKYLPEFIVFSFKSLASDGMISFALGSKILSVELASSVEYKLRIPESFIKNHSNVINDCFK